MSRRAVPDRRPVALTVAGSDSGGGAGIQADLKTMEAHGVFGTSAITSVTAQHTRGVESTHVLPVEEVDAQLTAVRGDFDVAAVKTGMLATTPVVERVTTRLGEWEVPSVVDPVMVATSGDRLLEPEAEAAYEALVREATLVTPNADEAEVLTGVAVEDETAMREAGEALVEMGADAALVKGGHVDTEGVIDLLVTEGASHRFESPRVDTAATHGSGCTLSSAIAANLAGGASLVEAVEAGVTFMRRAVRYPLDVGEGPGSVHHLVALRDRAARHATSEAVEGVVDRLVGEEKSRVIVPEVGLNVVGATPYAEETEDVAAVEGRITRTVGGVRPNRGVRFGASSHVARFLLSVREFVPTYRFAANCRYDARVRAALDDLGWRVASFDRGNEPTPEEEASTMGWGAARAFETGDDGDGDEPPVAVVDEGDVGKEPMTRVLAADAETLGDRLLELAAVTGEQ
ncbi:bifunctional hydroxymethylpyrimidine kinase/phosphomethylpyrimidine kinase [Salinigranum rubrum]|uniref:Bifunctional hydroxymethylpyrimidine kinase/phosphomethylpyrimidine kinase n=1 Tax=Salinigranum rubrum TaxID=755307 RepID=A0A2I8VNN4_9EURY|nr:bifunctional hydroxymethylpyrimidine kinase/phosphomethylpyrimidine kinase [Salinigranum rubrum]AUV82719.1 bifunctional hydroxymethylpyrimidine kinase/phosphomethylpyrimidine kinase [Salinigranum rubrum]